MKPICLKKRSRLISFDLHDNFLHITKIHTFPSLAPMIYLVLLFQFLNSLSLKNFLFKKSPHCRFRKRKKKRVCCLFYIIQLSHLYHNYLVYVVVNNRDQQGESRLKSIKSGPYIQRICYDTQTRSQRLKLMSYSSLIINPEFCTTLQSRDPNMDNLFKI